MFSAASERTNCKNSFYFYGSRLCSHRHSSLQILFSHYLWPNTPEFVKVHRFMTFMMYMEHVFGDKNKSSMTVWIRSSLQLRVCLWSVVIGGWQRPVQRCKIHVKISASAKEKSQTSASVSAKTHIGRPLLWNLLLINVINIFKWKCNGMDSFWIYYKWCKKKFLIYNDIILDNGNRQKHSSSLLCLKGRKIAFLSLTWTGWRHLS